MNKLKKSFFMILFLTAHLAVCDESISPFEEKAKDLNREMELLREELKDNYKKAAFLFQNRAEEAQYADLLEKIKAIKSTIQEKEKKWRKVFIEGEEKAEESYGFWDQGETTLSQLIMEYGSTDFLYIVPHELGSIKIHMCSNIPIPKESWNEMIELILLHNGIGIKKLTPYLRQVFILKHDLMNIEAVAQSLEDLKHLSNSSWVFYVFSARVEELRAVQAFFERFADPKQTTIQIVGNKIVLIATRESIEKLMEIYRAIWGKEQEKIVRIFPSKKIPANEAEKILKTFFQESSSKNRPSFYNAQNEDLAILSLPQGTSVVLVGTAALVEKAEKILKDLEEGLQESGEMTLFWYTCKHSNPEDLAHVLESLYSSLSQSSMSNGEKFSSDEKEDLKKSLGPSPLPVAPSFVQPTKIDARKGFSKENIVVDSKTGSLFMVVRREDLPKIQLLIEKLDVPKKMVQIDVMLLEKKLLDHSQTGINLFKIGSSRGVHETSLSFDTSSKATKKGILDFILSRPKGSLPSFDLLASFLMAQEDLRINANPSVLAVNQTAATISIVEEISINNGAVSVEGTHKAAVEKSYTRAQYGITISLLPIIHISEEEEKKGFITLQTNVSFDTTHVSEDDRPPVTRRHIENEVCVEDGETIILGGLKRNSTEEGREKIPFLGDIPGIGKLFGTSKMNNSSTEMFIFITPHIMGDSKEEQKKFRQEVLQKRPGDLPEFLEKLSEAKELQKKKLFEKSLRLLWDRA
jgi:general secretion pathway protein D